MTTNWKRYIDAQTPEQREERFLSRFWARVQKTSTCWIWTGGTGRGGYGITTRNGKAMGAHRIAYELARGPIPAGLPLDHICRVHACVNPDHLEPVTTRINVARGISPTAINARKTHCKRGHEFTPENTRTKGNERTCSYLHPRDQARRLCAKAAGFVMKLLCRLGWHSPAWQLQPGADVWLYIRRCTRCGHPLGRRRR